MKALNRSGLRLFLCSKILIFWGDLGVTRFAEYGQNYQWWQLCTTCIYLYCSFITIINELIIVNQYDIFIRLPNGGRLLVAMYWTWELPFSKGGLLMENMKRSKLDVNNRGLNCSYWTMRHILVHRLCNGQRLKEIDIKKDRPCRSVRS